VIFQPMEHQEINPLLVINTLLIVGFALATWIVIHQARGIILGKNSSKLIWFTCMVMGIAAAGASYIHFQMNDLWAFNVAIITASTFFSFVFYIAVLLVLRR